MNAPFRTPGQTDSHSICSEGMTCAAFVGRVERALKELDGAIDAHPQSGRSKRPSADVFKQRGAADAAKGHRDQRQRQECDQDRYADMDESEYEGHGQPERHAGRRGRQIGCEHRLAVSKCQRMYRAEQDSHRELGCEQRPVSSLREIADAIGEGEVDVALDGDEVLEQAHHARMPSVAAVSTI